MLDRASQTRQHVCIPAVPGRTVAQALFEAGFFLGLPLCAGAGVCGQCAVRFLGPAPEPCPEDYVKFSEAELDAGWRLACRHGASQAWKLEVPVQPATPGPASGLVHPCLGLDLGTTRVKWTSGIPGRPEKEEAAINPQMAAGSEIMSRLAYAESGLAARERLHQLAVDFVETVIQAVQAKDIAVSGHAAMIALLLNQPTHGLAYAPYHAPWPGGSLVCLRAGLPDVYIPPVLGPFIGADISAGLGHLCWQPDIRYPYILADLGTNGEFVLAVDNTHFWATSVPMGPAIEGVGLLCGSPAGPGVLSHFQLTPHGLHWNNIEPATALSGTGYISLLAILRRIGLVSVDGHVGTPTSPLARKLAVLGESAWGKTVRITDAVWLAERDIEEFLKVKAGVNVAIQALLRAAGLGLSDIAAVYMAGALGEYAETHDLFTLGFLPAAFDTRVQVVGNTSLAGAFRASYDRTFQDWLARLPQHVRLVSLVDQPDFATHYVQAMRFAWHDV